MKSILPRCIHSARVARRRSRRHCRHLRAPRRAPARQSRTGEPRRLRGPGRTRGAAQSRRRRVIHPWGCRLRSGQKRAQLLRGAWVQSRFRRPFQRRLHQLENEHLVLLLPQTVQLRCCHYSGVLAVARKAAAARRRRRPGPRRRRPAQSRVGAAARIRRAKKTKKKATTNSTFLCELSRNRLQGGLPLKWT